MNTQSSSIPSALREITNSDNQVANKPGRLSMIGPPSRLPSFKKGTRNEDNNSNNVNVISNSNNGRMSGVNRQSGSLWSSHPARRSLVPNKNRASSAGTGTGSSSSSSVRSSSIGVGANRRKTSIGRVMSSGSGRGGVSSDPRQFNDKAFQRHCIQNIMQFLTEYGFDNVISPKILSSPSSRDFFNIVQFIYNTIDPNFKFTAKKEEEGVLSIFKLLKYPCTISKKSLLSAGTPHTWPSLLAAISWMVDALRYDEEMESSSLEGLEDVDTFWFDYISKAYVTFLAGEDESEVLENEFFDHYQTKIDSINAEIDVNEVKKTAIVNEINTLKTSGDQLEILEAEMKSRSEDVPKFRKLIQELESHKTVVQRRLDVAQEEFQEKEKEMANICRIKDEILKQIGTQDMNVKDVELLNKQKKQLEDDLELIASEKEEKEKVSWGSETNITKFLEQIETKLGEYHTLARKLKLIPESAKNAMGKNLLISSSTTASDSLLVPFIKNNIKPVVTRVQALYAQKVFVQTREELQLVDMLEKVERILAEKTVLKQNLTSRCTKLSSEDENANLEMEKEIDDLEKELKNVQDSILNTTEYSKSALEAANSKLLEMKSQLDAKVSLHAKEKAALIRNTLKSAEALISYKAETTQILSNLLEESIFHP